MKKVSDWFANYNAPTSGIEQADTAETGVLGNSSSSPVPPVLPAATGPGVLAPPKTTAGEQSTAQITQDTTGSDDDAVYADEFDRAGHEHAGRCAAMGLDAAHPRALRGTESKMKSDRGPNQRTV